MHTLKYLVSVHKWYSLENQCHKTINAGVHNVHYHGVIISSEDVCCNRVFPTRAAFSQTVWSEEPFKLTMTIFLSSRLRVNCVGVFDVLTFDNSQTNHLALMPQYQVLYMMIHGCGPLWLNLILDFLYMFFFVM